jgi:hypothetical protein
MNQKSSLREDPQFVSWTLTGNMPVRWVALILGVLAVASVAAEAALRLYASYVTKRDHLFRSDAQTGWSNAPNLPTTRINAAGEEWSIRTDQNGQRLIAQNILTPDTGF